MLQLRKDLFYTCEWLTDWPPAVHEKTTSGVRSDPPSPPPTGQACLSVFTSWVVHLSCCEIVSRAQVTARLLPTLVVHVVLWSTATLAQSKPPAPQPSMTEVFNTTRATQKTVVRLDAAFQKLSTTFQTSSCTHLHHSDWKATKGDTWGISVPVAVSGVLCILGCFMLLVGSGVYQHLELLGDDALFRQLAAIPKRTPNLTQQYEKLFLENDRAITSWEDPSIGIFSKFYTERADPAHPVPSAYYSARCTQPRSLQCLHKLTGLWLTKLGKPCCILSPCPVASRTDVIFNVISSAWHPVWAVQRC